MGDPEATIDEELRTGRIVPAGGPRFFAHACGYLEGRAAVTEGRGFFVLSDPGYEAVLELGYRRFGDLFFRPRCHGCRQCIPLRVRVDSFDWKRRWRRVWRRNEGIAAEVGVARADEAAVRVANAFYRHRAEARGWVRTEYTHASYFQQFCTGPLVGREVRYSRGGELLGVGLFDDLPDAVSAVIFHYRREWAPSSPGSFNVLWLIGRARARGVRYLHLGYWVPGSRSTSYKALFGPAEVLIDGRWIPLPEDGPLRRDLEARSR